MRRQFFWSALLRLACRPLPFLFLPSFYVSLGASHSLLLQLGCSGLPSSNHAFPSSQEQPRGPLLIGLWRVPFGLRFGLWWSGREPAAHHSSGSRLRGLKTCFHHFLFSQGQGGASLSNNGIFLYLHLCEDIFICSGKDYSSPRRSESLSYVMKKHCNCKLRVNVKTRWPLYPAECSSIYARLI